MEVPRGPQKDLNLGTRFVMFSQKMILGQVKARDQ
jgi:hypothetical protein